MILPQRRLEYLKKLEKQKKKKKRMPEFTRDGALGGPKAIVWTENEKKNRVPKSPC